MGRESSEVLLAMSDLAGDLLQTSGDNYGRTLL